MKKYLIGLFIGLSFVATTAYALIAFPVNQGGTGSASYSPKGIIVSSTTATGNLTSSSTPTADNWIATSTKSSRFPYASSTSFTTSGTTYISTTDGRLGVGTTSPFASLAVNPVAGAASNQFVVGSSTATALLIDNSGKLKMGTTSPPDAISGTSTMTVVSQQAGTTTIDFDARATTARTCFNVRDALGAATSFYFRGTAMIVETGRCK